MSVKEARRLVTRAMRLAVRETLSPVTKRRERRSIEEVGRVSRQFGQKVSRCHNAYAGEVNEFGAPNNVVDSWRFAFSRDERSLKPANDPAELQERG